METVVIGATYRSAPVALGVSGLTFTRDAASNASTIAGSNVNWNPSYTEIGSSGTYLFTYVTANLGFHTWAGSSSGGHQIGIAFTVVTAAQADPAAALSAQNLTVDAPLTTEADKEINVGDAETLQWSSTGWPSLSGQTATFQAYKLTTDAVVFASAKSVTITNAGQATQNLAVTLSSGDTDDFAPGVPYRYEIDSTAGALVSGKLSARSG